MTVIASAGSSPRGAGTRMMVKENGEIEGTIGGGALWSWPGRPYGKKPPAWKDLS